MASLNFPSSPAVSQTYVSGGKTWVWDGVSWNATAATTIAGPSGPSGPVGGSGPSGPAGPSGPTGPAATGVMAGSSTVGYLQYNGTTQADGQLYGGTTIPTTSTRLNYNGHLYATKFFGDGSSLTGVSGSVIVTDDTTTNAIRYLVWDDASSGQVSGVGVSTTKLYFNPSSGTLYSTIFQSLSDRNLKTNIQDIVDPVNSVMQLRGVKFNWIDGTPGDQYGFIAQEVESVIPELVEEAGGRKTVNYSGVIPFLVETVKKQQDQINQLTAEINKLKTGNA